MSMWAEVEREPISREDAIQLVPRCGHELCPAVYGDICCVENRP
jgi:hypothetical protein